MIRVLASSFAVMLVSAALAQSRDQARWEMYDRSIRLQQERDQARFDAEMADYWRRGDAQDTHITNLRQRLQQCGGCAERQSLEAELKQLDDGRKAALRVYCASFWMLDALNPGAVSAMAQLTGAQKICGGSVVDQRASEEAYKRSSRKRYEERARSGNPHEIWLLAQHYVKVEQREDIACHFYAVSSVKGYGPATVSYAGCVMDSGLAADMQRGAKMLGECADKGDASCMHSLGLLYSSLRHPKSPPSPLALDDQKALQLFDAAAAKGYESGKDAARQLRAKLGAGKTTTAQSMTPFPMPAPPTIVSTPREPSAAQIEAEARRKHAVAEQKRRQCEQLEARIAAMQGSGGDSRELAFWAKRRAQHEAQYARQCAAA